MYMVNEMPENERKILCKQLNGVYLNGECLQKIENFREPMFVKSGVFISSFIITLLLFILIVLGNYISIWYDEPFVALFNYASGDFVWYRWFNLFGIPYSTVILYNDPTLWWTIMAIFIVAFFVIVYISMFAIKRYWNQEKEELMKM